MGPGKAYLLDCDRLPFNRTACCHDAAGTECWRAWYAKETEMTRAELEDKCGGRDVFVATTETPNAVGNSLVCREFSYASCVCACGHEYIWSEFPIRYENARRKAQEWALKPCEACAPAAPKPKTQEQLLEEFEQDRMAGRTKYDNR